MKKVYFDLDDTLIPTQESYNVVKEDLSQHIAALMNQDASEVLATFEKIDLENANDFGLSRLRFPTSWCDTYAHFGGDNLEEERVIWEVAEQIFEMMILPYPESGKVLEETKALGYELHLLTAGDPDVQEKRITDSGLQPYFDYVHIVPTKNTRTMKDIIKEPKNAVMVGNSLSSDIQPAISLGMKTIHIERETWAYDQTELNKNAPEYISSLLSEVPKHLKTLH